MARDEVVAAIDARIPRGSQGRGGFTPRAWVAIENAAKVASDLGHQFVGTEHLLLSLLTGVGGVAEQVLTERGVTKDQLQGYILERLAGA